MNLTALTTLFNSIVSEWNQRLSNVESRKIQMSGVSDAVSSLRGELLDLIEDSSFRESELAPAPQSIGEFRDVPPPEEGKYLGTTGYHRRFIWKLPKSITKIADLVGGPSPEGMISGNIIKATSSSTLEAMTPRAFATMQYQTQSVLANGLDSPLPALLTNSVWVIDIDPSVTLYEFKLRPTRNGDRILLIVTESSPASGSIYLTAGAGLTFNFGLDDLHDGGARRPLFGGMTYSLLFSDTHSTWLVEEVGGT